MYFGSIFPSNSQLAHSIKSELVFKNLDALQITSQERIIQYKQTLDMILDNDPINNIQQLQSSPDFKDFILGERIKKVSTHDLFQLRGSGQSYVAKLFKPQFRHNYELQLNILSLLNHPNIVELRYFQPADTQLPKLWNCDMLIFKHAQKGSLNQYIPMNGKLSQQVARVIFKQMISALKYASSAQPNRIIHPDLQPSSILLDSSRQVRICGWSKETPKKPQGQLIKNLMFNCCQILTLMLTSYMPFFKKQSPVDPLYKYLKPGMMNNFWLKFEKRISAKYKLLQLSAEVKQLIQKVFLHQWTTFEQIQASAWMQIPALSHSQFSQLLAQIQNKSAEKRHNLLEKQQQRQQRNQQILKDYEEQTLRGSSNRSSGKQNFFIQDFYDNFYNKQDIPPVSECAELIRLNDDRPNFVIASLKQQLRNQQDNQMNEINLIFGGQLQLQNYSVQKRGNQAYLQLNFQQINPCQEELEDTQIKVKALIRFFKNTTDNHLFAQVQILESSLSEYYDSVVISLIQSKIKRLKS